MELKKLKQDFAVCKLANRDNVDFTGEYVFLCKTDDEISLVCEAAHVPTGAIAVESGWKGLKIAGVLDFGMVGIIAKISNILAQAGISVFVVSTYNTDYIFVKAENYEKCVHELVCNGYVVE
ncbi:MAG: ACT domain-containing protein [Firmicutes bacterium]|nr:ACT domain-containing protein [Bacillota bacterium]